MTNKFVYHFKEGTAAMCDILGGKGAGLAEMTRIGLPVPPGFTISTEACLAYLKHSGVFPEGLWQQILAGIKNLEIETGREFADPQNPLLVSVRSGARYSMPGMMDTILNLGLNDNSVRSLATKAGDKFAWDAYRRLVQMFGHVVLGVADDLFEDIIQDIMKAEKAAADSQVSARGWQRAVAKFQQLIQDESGLAFPQDSWEQLERAVEAVFKSWNIKRAVDYRNATGISHSLGTAVNIVAMVFGNVGSDSGSGVVFSRNPVTGARALYGEYLMDAQGEDVVSGARTPLKIHQLESEAPGIWKALRDTTEKLENHYREMQDMEFTIERGKLWMLQTRSGKRTSEAAIKIAVDMVKEGLISQKEAIARIEPWQIENLLHPHFNDEEKKKAEVLAVGLNASPGAAVGKVYFDATTAEKMSVEEGREVILVSPETTPDDLHGMIAAKGMLTQHGGATSHAAVVARQLGKPCVAGCESIDIDLRKHQFRIGSKMIKEGDTISLDGTTGEVFEGTIPMVAPDFNDQKDLNQILNWADASSRLKVWANADTPEQARLARGNGAQGIGLCRTEHMFMGERTAHFQDAILAEEKNCQRLLDEVLLPLQRQDFYDIFQVMDGLPVVIRLLDPPLHEFLPPRDELLVEITRMESTGKTNDGFQKKKELLSIVSDMAEMNPMLGLRGCRLGLTRPVLNRMQVRAIFEAACDASRDGIEVRPEVMVPLTSHFRELEIIKSDFEVVAEQVMRAKGVRVDYKFGTMIEIPRAALTADEIANEAEFFSFGTNDLTQMTYGISRDDAERKFLVEYIKKGILKQNPFQTLDVDGVGQLITTAIKKGRKTRSDLKIGVCGEHGGDPDSIAFFNRVGLDYVSCSPFRIPIARLAAAHAAIAAGDV